jgi:hypothetical protein
MGLPPLLAGATKVTLMYPSWATADGAGGALGTVAGMTAADDGDSALVPLAFVASTVHVYVVPLTMWGPNTMIGELAPDLVVKNVPSLQVAL